MHGALAHPSTSARHCSRQDACASILYGRGKLACAKLAAVEAKSRLGATDTTDGSCVHSKRHQGGLALLSSMQWSRGLHTLKHHRLNSHMHTRFAMILELKCCPMQSNMHYDLLSLLDGMTHALQMGSSQVFTRVASDLLRQCVLA